MPYDSFPAKASLKPEPFNAHVADSELEAFKQLLKLSRIGPKTYENQVADPKDYRSFGVKREWLAESKEHWLNDYNWRKAEDRINSYNNYTVDIEHLGFKFHVHFAALLSKKKDAVPLLLMHGWPGTFMEFFAVLDEFKNKFDENSLPFHVIVPSLPGTAYSNGPPIDQNFNVEGIAVVMDKLMLGLGYESGYIAQGGDIGSFVARVLYTTSSSCKAVHCKISSPTDELVFLNIYTVGTVLIRSMTSQSRDWSRTRERGGGQSHERARPERSKANDRLH